jgi:hypothetical protein
MIGGDGVNCPSCATSGMVEDGFKGDLGVGYGGREGPKT